MFSSIIISKSLLAILLTLNVTLISTTKIKLSSFILSDIFLLAPSQKESIFILFKSILISNKTLILKIFQFSIIPTIIIINNNK